VTELVLADGPTRYLGGSIETFALPYGAFILIAAVLYFFFKRPHSVPRMRYLSPAHQVSTGTREPGQGGMIRLRGAMPASAAAIVAEAETGVPGLQPPGASETLQDPDILPATDSVHPADEAGVADEAAAANEAAVHEAGADEAGAGEAGAGEAGAGEAEGSSDAGA
jgi:hypothetical protein